MFYSQMIYIVACGATFSIFPMMLFLSPKLNMRYWYPGARKLVPSDLSNDDTKRIIVQDFKNNFHQTQIKKIDEKHIFKLKNTKYIVK